MNVIRSVGLTLAVSISLVASSGAVASAQVFEAGNIISDSIFANNTTMNADSIQGFIRTKNANCVAGEAPCLRDFTENGKSAGTIIKEAADTYRINPQTLLVLLQKETGLITRSQPTLWYYKIATGYGCPDTAVCDSQYYGFTNQVHKAARMFRFIMDDNPNWYTPYELGVNYIQYNPEASCGGSNVNIQNRATQALYNYTPYQPNTAALAAGFGTGDDCSAYGNRNFWLYFNTWFGSTQSSVLLQSPQSPAVYLQSGGTRYGIPEWEVINAYGLSGTPVTPVSDVYMNSLTDGGVLSTIFSNKSQPGPIFLADNGNRYGFATHQQCIDWGFPRCLDTSYARALEPSIFDRLNDAGAISSIMQYGATYHLMSEGKKNTFLSSKAFAESGYGLSKLTKIVNAPNSRQPYSYSIPENNSFVQFKNNPAIYVYTQGKFYPLSWNAYQGLLGNHTPYVFDNFSRYVTSPPTSEPMTGSYIKLSNGTSFALTGGQKIDITAVASDWPDQQPADPLRTIIDRRAADVIADSNSTFRTPAGSILRIEAKQWRGFYNLSDYFALGYSNPITISNNTLYDFSVGHPIFAPGNGSLYQVLTTSQTHGIFTTSSDGSICQIYSIPQLGLYKFGTSNVHRINELSSTKINILSTSVYDESGNVHLVYDGIHSIIPSTELANKWGIKNKMNICGLKGAFLSKNPVNLPAPKFVRNEHTGIIYYGENGYKRPIYSYNAFLRMGGNSSNTLNTSMEFLVSAPDGVPIYQ